MTTHPGNEANIVALAKCLVGAMVATREWCGEATTDEFIQDCMLAARPLAIALIGAGGVLVPGALTDGQACEVAMGGSLDGVVAKLERIARGET